MMKKIDGTKISVENLDYITKTRTELITICKEKKITGHSGKKNDIIDLIENSIEQLEQDTGKFRKNTNDQFYTNENVAKSCIKLITDTLPETFDYLWIEPSAGNGSFYTMFHRLLKKLGSISSQWRPTYSDRIFCRGILHQTEI